MQLKGISKMIGILVVGHGKVPSGLRDAIRLIVGEQKEFYIADFTSEITTKEYEIKVKKCLDDLETRCDGILVFADMAGGSPYTIVKKASQEHNKITVITGVNLPMLLEVVTVREFERNFDEFSNVIIQSARDQITIKEYGKSTSNPLK